MEPMMDDLFRWFKEVTIGGKKFWCRTLSAADDSERTKRAIGASRLARAKLLEEGSMDRADLLAMIGVQERGNLIAGLRLYNTEMAKMMANSEVHPLDPPEVTGDTLDDVLDVEDAKVEQALELAKRRDKFVIERTDQYMKILDEKTDDEIREEAIGTEISSLTQRSYIDEFERQTLERAYYTDKAFTKRAFADATALDGKVYRKLLDEYYDLDRFASDAEALKN